MYEEAQATMLKLAVVLPDYNWQVKALDFCKGSDFVLRINGQNGEIEVVELDYCRSSDLFLVEDVSTPSATPIWKIVEFGDCSGLSHVLYSEDSIQKWTPIAIGDCMASSIVFFKPNGSREWRSQKLGICPANGSLLCLNEQDGSWDETILGSCQANATILHYKAKPKTDIETLIKQVNEQR